MPIILDPFRFVAIAVAGWMNQRQLQIIEYPAKRTVLFANSSAGDVCGSLNEQRRRLAAKAGALGRKLLAEVATIVTPETLLRWHPRLIAQKYDGGGKRAPGRPRTIVEIEELIVQMAEQNRDWGYRRIQGAMSNLGQKLARQHDR